MTATEPSPSGDGKVQIAYLHQDDVSHSWAWSMMALLIADRDGPRRTAGAGQFEGPLGLDTPSCAVPRNRNLAMARWLDQTPYEWLLWLDTDMGVRPDVIEQLLAAADPESRPVVGALCFGWAKVADDGMGGWSTRPVPTIYADAPDGDGFRLVWDVPRDALVKCAGTGSACILIHRTAAEKVRAEFGDRWYDQWPLGDGHLLGEDLSFCRRLSRVDIPVHVATSIKTTHAKHAWVGEADYESYRRPPVATEPVAVIVPVLRRPEAAAPFMASLRSTTGLARVYAVADEDDYETVDAWRAAGARVIQVGPGRWDVGSYAEKVNEGYRSTRESWLFLAGDDVRFWPGWYDRALAAAGDNVHVIGTNDLANGSVIAGEHATHMLIRRSYVEEVGASWDGPGVVTHEGYRHSFVDVELVEAAKARGVWVPCTAAVVEHLHPIAGKAPDDEVYQLGRAAADADQKLFLERRAVNL